MIARCWLRGKDYWRSLEELAQTPEFQELVERRVSRPGRRMDQPGQTAGNS